MNAHTLDKAATKIKAEVKATEFWYRKGFDHGMTVTPPEMELVTTNNRSYICGYREGAYTAWDAVADNAVAAYLTAYSNRARLIYPDAF